LQRESETFEAVEWPAGWSKLRDQFEERDWPPRRLGLREGREGRGFIWTTIGHTPVIAHAINGPGWGRGDGGRSRGAVLIELNEEAIRRTFLPELAQRYFGAQGGSEYEVAVISTAVPAEIIYSSLAHLKAADFTTADWRQNLILEPRDYLAMLGGDDPPARADRPRGAAGPGEPDGPEGSGGPRPGFPQGPEGRDRDLGPGGRRPGPPVFLFTLEAQGWELVVRHSQGSLDMAVAQIRRRNLAISFGVLLLLAVSVGMVYLSAQRARRLAGLQMEFIAGVSHELRTPLAVIRSAADNLADGVIEEPAQVAQYGKIIGGEGRRLSSMIEQTLLFAASQSATQAYELRDVPVEAVIERTIRELDPAIEAAGARVEASVAPALPAVRSNDEALGRILTNLVENALKYGGDDKWLGIRTAVAVHNGRPEVQIHVEDRGPGIESGDLSHIFEPFYRGRLAIENQIRGSGLGLHLAQRISRAVGARVTVESRAGKGSVFTVHLPVSVSAASKPPQVSPNGVAGGTRD
jgi:signal transduction histidine kinase